MRRSLSRKDRLRRNSEIRELFSSAARIDGAGSEAPLPDPQQHGQPLRGRRRAGMRRSRPDEIGKNGSRREAYRSLKEMIPPGHDLLSSSCGSARHTSTGSPRCGSWSAAQVCGPRSDACPDEIPCRVPHQHLPAGHFARGCPFLPLRSQLFAVREGSPDEARLLQGIVPRCPEDHRCQPISTRVGTTLFPEKKDLWTRKTLLAVVISVVIIVVGMVITPLFSPPNRSPPRTGSSGTGTARRTCGGGRDDDGKWPDRSARAGREAGSGRCSRGARQGRRRCRNPLRRCRAGHD